MRKKSVLQEEHSSKDRVATAGQEPQQDRQQHQQDTNGHGYHTEYLENRRDSYMPKSEDMFQEHGRHGRNKFGRVHQSGHGKIHHLRSVEMFSAKSGVRYHQITQDVLAIHLRQMQKRNIRSEGHARIYPSVRRGRSPSVTDLVPFDRGTTPETQ